MKKLNLLAKCPNCGRKHNNSKTHIIEQKGDMTTLHITCGHCNVSVLVLVSEGSIGLVSVGMMIDLDKEEVKRFISKDPVTVDEIIEVHKLLTMTSKSP